MESGPNRIQRPHRNPNPKPKTLTPPPKKKKKLNPINRGKSFLCDFCHLGHPSRQKAVGLLGGFLASGASVLPDPSSRNIALNSGSPKLLTLGYSRIPNMSKGKFLNLRDVGRSGLNCCRACLNPLSPIFRKCLLSKTLKSSLEGPYNM